MDAAQSKATEPRPRIFVVDDSKTIRVQLQHMLKSEFDCETFSDGPSAIAAALASPPDLILSDVVMEPYDGYELCRKVREQPLLKDTPLVLLTSSEDRDGRALGLEQGADDYLPKPVHVRELFARVRSLLRLREAQREILGQQQRLEASNQRLIQTQQDLLSAEKLATLGTLAAGVAHEVNNPLSFVISGVQQLVDAVDELAGPDVKKADRDQVVQDVAEIKEEVLMGLNRIRSIVRDLGRFATEPDKAPGALDLSKEVEAAVVACKPKLAQVEVRVELGHEATVLAPNGYLSQMLQNLISNAADAVQGAAAPRITIQSRDCAKGVELTVADNGCGMDDSVKARLFEPFFTTKKAGKGAGLGLSICQSLVHRLSGTIECATEKGKGARFKIVIPLRQPDSANVFNRARKVVG